MSGDLDSRTWGPDVQATDDEKKKVVLLVDESATDESDRRLLLDALGLLPMTVTDHGIRGYRQGCTCKQCRRANAARNRRQRAAHDVTTTADCPINTTTTGGTT